MQLVSQESNVRLDKYLRDNLDYSREYIQKMIKDQNVKVNNKLAKASQQLVIGDVIDFRDIPQEKDDNITPVKMDLDIVYEDEYLMVINKPSGLVVHPGSGNKENTLVSALLYYTKNLSNIGGLERPGIVHRIDKDTSGLLLIAKTNQVHQLLSEDFKNKRIYREYIALVNGVILSDTATIDAPIGRDSKYREKMAVTVKNSKKALTNIQVLKRYLNHTLISCVLATGRTHQIRVHLAYIGHPVFNDPVYATSSIEGFGQFLHSYKMKFIHPITKKQLEFTCPLPKVFQDYLDSLN